MKIIELLNKIANSEISPKRIYCFNREFYLKENNYFGDTFTLMHYIQEEDLNDEVEILEEEKKIPEETTVSEEQMLFNNLTTIDQEYVIRIMKMLQQPIDYLKSKGE